MKLKALLPLMMVSGIATASDYNFEVNGTYTDMETKIGSEKSDFDTLDLDGTFYLNGVNLTGPWAESAFLDHASYIKFGYSDLDDGDKEYTLGGKYYIDNLVLGLSFDYADSDEFGSDNSQTLSLGYLIKDNWQVGFNYINTEEDGAWFIDSKSVTELGGNKWLAFDVSYTSDDSITEDYFVELSGTYYLNEQLGFGATYVKDGSDFDGYGLHASYFVNENVAIELGYMDAEADIADDFKLTTDGWSLSLKGRF